MCERSGGGGGGGSDVTHLENAWPDGEARDEQEADDDERRKHVAQTLGSQENPREVAGWIERIVRAHLPPHVKHQTPDTPDCDKDKDKFRQRR